MVYARRDSRVIILVQETSRHDVIVYWQLGTHGGMPGALRGAARRLPHAPTRGARAPARPPRAISHPTPHISPQPRQHGTVHRVTPSTRHKSQERSLQVTTRFRTEPPTPGL